jgi:hypothetical protein
MVCTLSMAQLHHNCGAGYRWFENYGAYFAAVVVLASIMAFRRAVFAVAVAALSTLVFDFAVGPVYIKWVHSPYAPPFSGSTFSTQVLEDLRTIDELANDNAVEAATEAGTPIVAPSIE